MPSLIDIGLSQRTNAAKLQLYLRFRAIRYIMLASDTKPSILAEAQLLMFRFAKNALIIMKPIRQLIIPVALPMQIQIILQTIVVQTNQFRPVRLVHITKLVAVGMISKKKPMIRVNGINFTVATVTAIMKVIIVTASAKVFLKMLMMEDTIITNLTYQKRPTIGLTKRAFATVS